MLEKTEDQKKQNLPEPYPPASLPREDLQSPGDEKSFRIAVLEHCGLFLVADNIACKQSGTLILASLCVFVLSQTIIALLQLWL